jgi:hypothetical protein
METEMTQVSEIAEQGHTSPELPKQSRSERGLALAQMLKNPGALNKFRGMGSDEPARSQTLCPSSR